MTYMELGRKLFQSCRQKVFLPGSSVILYFSSASCNCKKLWLPGEQPFLHLAWSIYHHSQRLVYHTLTDNTSLGRAFRYRKRPFILMLTSQRKLKDFSDACKSQGYCSTACQETCWKHSGEQCPTRPARALRMWTEGISCYHQSAQHTEPRACVLTNAL